MLFCIPLLPKARSRDWARVGTLLSGTFRSLANQINSQFEVLLCAHELPDTFDAHGVPFTLIEADWAPEAARRGRTDKDWKVRMLGARARAMGGGLLMQLDGDDLVSNRLVEHVLRSDAPHGHLLETGYMLDSASGRIAPLPGTWPRKFDYYCGSCAVFRMTPDDLPRDRHDEANRWSRLGSGHHHWGEQEAKAGRPLTPVPFPAAMYLQNSGENLHAQRHADRDEAARTAIAAAALTETAAIHAEFGILSEPPSGDNRIQRQG